jgi:menaquinone-dependent protoporphyrinogen oxidase
VKTLILFATKHGAAREISKRIAEKISGAVIHDLKESDIPPLADFDCVIIGGSLYAGMLRKEAKKFLTDNKDALAKKKVGIFLSGLDASKEKEYFDANIPAEILQASKTAAFLGGIFDPKKAGLFGRMIMKAVAKQTEYADVIDNEKIQKFVEDLQEGKAK